jgi:beta-galactosidase
MTLLLPLDHAWNFRRVAADGAAAGAWSAVDLPHSPFVADLDGQAHWFGECEYERSISLPPDAPKGRCALYVGAAMHSAVVFVDGIEKGRHTGGYLPFEIDLTDALRDGRAHTLTLRLDNRDNADIPPGKPYADLDFCWYGGLYRGAELRCYPALHITDPVGAGEVASGGVFVRSVAASAAFATVSVKTHVRNDSPVEAKEVQVQVELLQGPVVVARAVRTGLSLGPGSAAAIELELVLTQPRLWQPDSPTLHHAQVKVVAADGKIADARTVRFGIRRIGFSRSGGFTINGARLRLRGTNRHQDHPYVGYALPAAAQRRDARRIKEAGFDYVRLSHYPQSPHFLDACDELGIVVMNCIPGWQFLGGERFRAACYQNARDVIRRDRNHPCVVLWELSLNETLMDDAFMARLQAIGHEEYPGDQMFTCGWQDHYDVFIHSRQHGRIHDWQNRDKALVVAEYGDWEFYASNHGFDQKTGAALLPSWSNARQRRQDGERGLLQQVANHLTALNDTLSSPAVLDGQWSMFDYPRGYHPHRAACGVMDIFRLPKFSYYFYRSQRDANEQGAGWTGGPLVYIASHWTPGSDLRLPVFTNCEEVELRLNGTLLSRQTPGLDRATNHLSHPPCVFILPAFSPGVLEATGFIGGKPAASHRVTTPGAPERLEVEVDDAGILAEPGAPDVLIAHARVVDVRGTLCVGDVAEVSFTIVGEAEIVGPATIAAEAGVASVVLRLPPSCRAFALRAARTGTEGTFIASCLWQHPSPDKLTGSERNVSVPLGVLR